MPATYPLTSPNGTEFNPRDVPERFAPAFCCLCECRTGWFDAYEIDEPLVVCEDCIAEVANGDMELDS